MPSLWEEYVIIPTIQSGRRAFQLNVPVSVAFSAPAVTKSVINLGTKSVQLKEPSIVVVASMILRMKFGTKLLHVKGVSAHAVFATQHELQTSNIF